MSDKIGIGFFKQFINYMANYMKSKFYLIEIEIQHSYLRSR